MRIPEVGEPFRHFRILARAGEGGMGVVLEAEDVRLARKVALKFLTRPGALDEEAAERLRAEARALAALRHANIVTIHDLDEEDGAPFLVLEWVEGAPLSEVVHGRAVGEEEFLRVTLPVAEALAAAHSRGIVHRDLKPGNVLVGDDGVVKLADFGLAKSRDADAALTREATLVGTAAYMSPEQASGEEAGPASDVFSFGVLAYELLAGTRPFEAPNVPALLRAIVQESQAPIASRRPGTSPDLAALVERCLRKRPEERFAGGAELAQALFRVARSRTAAMTREVAAPAAGLVPRRSGGPEIRYARAADGASIAYSTYGSGPPIVRVLGWFTHLEIEWEWPGLRLIWERLGESHTVVRYDGRGIGLSGPWPGEFTEETRQLDLDAVIGAIGAEKVVLYGISEGGWTAAQYAARHPERVSHLVIYGGYSRGSTLRPGYDPEETRAVLTLMRKGWGLDTPKYRQIFTTMYFGADADPALVAHFNHLQRAAADGDTAVRYQESLDRRGDGREEFSGIRVPTLVLHCRDDQIIPFEEGRVFASTVPGAQFLPFPTGAHYFPVDDDVTRRMSDAIVRFTRGA